MKNLLNMAMTTAAIIGLVSPLDRALAAEVTAAAETASAGTDSDTTLDAGDRIEAITVTARNTKESVQDVPIPISVLGSQSLTRDYTVDVQDLTQKAPGLEATTPNSRRTGISLRGIGKSAGNDALEASVGVLVDGIYLSHPGMTYQDFTDLDRVEVLRGPQGTLLGKNTTIGAISFVNREPSKPPASSMPRRRRCATTGSSTTPLCSATYRRSWLRAPNLRAPISSPRM